MANLVKLKELIPNPFCRTGRAWRQNAKEKQEKEQHKEKKKKKKKRAERRLLRLPLLSGFSVFASERKADKMASGYQ